MLGIIDLDSDIIPDEKERRFKESMQLFRHACNLQDAIHQLELSPNKNQKMEMIYLLAITELQKKRDEILNDAINRYNKTKGIKEDGVQ